MWVRREILHIQNILWNSPQQPTLEMFESYGGDDAFINIKYMVPTYESCVLNWAAAVLPPRQSFNSSQKQGAV